MSFEVGNVGFALAGDEARRAVKVAREAEFVVGDLAWLGVACVWGWETGRGLEGGDPVRRADIDELPAV